MIDYNNSDYSEINGDLNNVDVSCENGFTNSHTLSQCNESSYFKYMDGDVKNVDVSDGHFFMNSHTLSEENKPSYLDSTKKSYGNIPNVYEMEDTELYYGVEIDAIYSISKLHKNSNIFVADKWLAVVRDHTLC